jgi:RNA polymerase sigma factor (sigma-70 family)
LAAEALQDAFLKVFQHLDSFEGRSSLGAWIKRIVVREALTTLRRQKPAFDDLNDQTMQEEVIDWGQTPIDAEYLEQAIAGLPDGFRTVFLLAEVEGYSHKEIAAMLQVSEGTSKSQLWAAKKRLRSLLAPFSTSNSTLA